jgi:hypothetical protein
MLEEPVEYHEQYLKDFVTTLRDNAIDDTHTLAVYAQVVRDRMRSSTSTSFTIGRKKRRIVSTESNVDLPIFLLEKAFSPTS